MRNATIVCNVGADQKDFACDATTESRCPWQDTRPDWCFTYQEMSIYDTFAPTLSPTYQTNEPSVTPTIEPSAQPIQFETFRPTSAPTTPPIQFNTFEPTSASPTPAPTGMQTIFCPNPDYAYYGEPCPQEIVCDGGDACLILCDGPGSCTGRNISCGN